MAVIADNAYGKSGIRLVRVERSTARHQLRDWTVAVRFRGAYEAAYLAGDNTGVLPTDTMKNTVYAFAKERPFGEPEDFALALSEHFLAGNAEARSVEIEIVERPWTRLGGSATPHAHSFTPDALRRHAWAARTREQVTTRAGVSEMVLLKTTESGFSDFRRDRYTTLPETGDRILATTVEATWEYAQPPADYAAAWSDVRQALEASFTSHFSRSVQETIWILGNAALGACSALDWIHLRLPNLHHLPVDLSPFGLDGRGEVFVATSAPYGLIEGTVRRDAVRS